MSKEDKNLRDKVDKLCKKPLMLTDKNTTFYKVVDGVLTESEEVYLKNLLSEQKKKIDFIKSQIKERGDDFKYKTNTPQQIAKKYLQVTELEEELAKDIEAYADSKVQEYKVSLELKAVSIDDNNEMLNSIREMSSKNN